MVSGLIAKSDLFNISLFKSVFDKSMNSPILTQLYLQHRTFKADLLSDIEIIPGTFHRMSSNQHRRYLRGS